ncbi:MAG: T9SS type A sorting domain-containing protein [bacterium]
MMRNSLKHSNNRISFYCTIFLLLSYIGLFAQTKSERSFAVLSDYNNLNNPTEGIEIQDVFVGQINQLNMNPPIMYSTEGIIMFNYQSQDPHYLTIGAQTSLGNFSFISQNAFAPPSPSFFSRFAIRFDMGELGIEEGEQWPPSLGLQIFIHFSRTPMPEPPQEFYTFAANVAPVDDDASNEYADETNEEEPQINTENPAPNLNSPITVMHHYGCTVPNVDLDNGEYPASSSYAGDKNACGPAAAANSMAWMASAFSEITIPFSHRALLDSLSKYMKRQANGGVSIETFVKGKLDFIRAHNLPIKVKFQAENVEGDINDSGEKTFADNQNEGNYPTWDFLKGEMADSEDVEIFYKWHDGEKWRSHAVVVTGTYETENGKKTIGIKHDLRQAGQDGTVQEFPEITVDEHGRMIVNRHGRKRYISHIISESPGEPNIITNLNNSEEEKIGFYLEQNYPNPFNPTTVISFQLSVISQVNLKIYDVLGREIAILVNEEKKPGTYKVNFDAKNLPSGVYFYTLITNSFNETKKMTLIR